MKKADIISITSSYGLHPSKKYGQNFLVDDATTERILQIIDITPHDTILEIDAGFCRYLRDHLGAAGNFTLVHSDFLKTQLDDVYTKVVSNLPYYCASEILFTIAERFSARDVFVMVQKEMADRIMSSPGTKVYGALTVTLGYYYRSRAALQLGNDVFYPRPEVGSTFLQLTRREERELNDTQLEMFHLLVKSAFWGRRKTLARSLTESPHLNLDREQVRRVLDAAGIDEKMRGEQLRTADFVRLALLFEDGTSS